MLFATLDVLIFGCGDDNAKGQSTDAAEDAGTDVSFDDTTADSASSDADLGGDVATPPVDLELESEWTLSGMDEDYGMSIDYDVTFDGYGASIRLQSVVPEPRYRGVLTTELDAGGNAGHRLRLSAWVLAEDMEGYGGLVFVVEDANGRYLGVDYMYDRPITSADDWTEFSSVLDAPVDADSITFGVWLRGGGRVWLDGARLEVVDETVPSTDSYPLEGVNLDFEGGLNPVELPIGWLMAGDALLSEQDVGLDTERAYQGDASVRITSTAADGRFATLMQMIRPDNYIGQRIRLSAYIATEDLETSVHLWFRIDGVDQMLGFDNMRDRPVVGTTDWTEYSNVLDVPEGATNIAFGAFVIDAGTLWFDDVRLDVVDETVPTTNLLDE